jgi:tripartite-type tricarboxylate transporter receptor subunit TctC
MRALVLVFLSLLLAPAQAQNWPTRHVSMLVGYPAGSGIDTVARFLSEGLRGRTGQPFVVENRPGATGNIAAAAVSRAAPDGYTVLFTPNSTHGINPSMYKTLGFDPIKDFAPVTTLLSLGFVLVVNPKVVPVSSVAELTSYVKARPSKLAYGSGNATGRVAAELYRQLTGIDAVHVPYKGVPPVVNDLLGGQVHFAFIDATLGLPTARSGKLRALAVTNVKRISAAPDLPTMAEAGVQGFELEGWFAVFLPAGTSREIVQRLADHSNAIMTSDKGRELLRSLGADPLPGSPESLAKLIATEIPRWQKVVKAAGIEPE